jgi:hypothetical protein
MKKKKKQKKKQNKQTNKQTNKPHDWNRKTVRMKSTHTQASLVFSLLGIEFVLLRANRFDRLVW